MELEDIVEDRTLLENRRKTQVCRWILRFYTQTLRSKKEVILLVSYFLIHFNLKLKYTRVSGTTLYGIKVFLFNP